jgi:hypothetical protein
MSDVLALFAVMFETLSRHVALRCSCALIVAADKNSLAVS